MGQCGHKTPPCAISNVVHPVLDSNPAVYTGLISLLLGFFGPWVLRTIPAAGLFVPVAGVGIAFLGLQQVSYCVSAPIVGFNAMLWVYLGWYAGVRIVIWTPSRCFQYIKALFCKISTNSSSIFYTANEPSGFKLPAALQVILVGVILSWMTGLNRSEDVQDAAKNIQWVGPAWSGNDLFGTTPQGESIVDLVKQYVGVIIPLGVSSPALSLMCLVGAKRAGDPYPIRETLVVDGLGTMISSLFGSPFGTVVYIGHPAYKRSGAQVGYSFANGVLFLIFSWLNMMELIQSIVNPAVVGKFCFSSYLAI